MNSYMYRIIVAGMCMAIMALVSVAQAAESADKGSVDKSSAERSSIEQLVATQPAKPAATGIDAASDPSATVNFSDFVKDGAGCGVPNLDTSSK